MEDVLRRLSALEHRDIQVADLPLAALQRKLEQSWKPSDTRLLQVESTLVTAGLTFVNTFANYGAGNSPLGYYRLYNGLIVTQGLVKVTVNQAANASIATGFPAPADGTNHRIATNAKNDNIPGSLALTAAGVLSWYTPAGGMNVGDYLDCTGVYYAKP